jgi:Predicted nucleotide-binding protein containing TIR-like domain
MEGLPIAKAVSQHLEGIADVSIWNEGVFGLMEGNLENLVSVLDRFDFAVLVITADDTLIKREDTRQAPRDNIMFELGLFMGRLGRKRVFAMAPLIDRMHLPPDLAGVSLAIYNPFKDPSEAPRATRSACIRIENAILRRDGPIVRYGCRWKLTTEVPMKVATAPVNWNSPHVPDYRPSTPYPQLLEEMKAAGYTATEWSTDMPKDPAVLAADLQARGLGLLWGMWS